MRPSDTCNIYKRLPDKPDMVALLMGSNTIQGLAVGSQGAHIDQTPCSMNASTALFASNDQHPFVTLHHILPRQS